MFLISQWWGKYWPVLSWSSWSHSWPLNFNESIQPDLSNNSLWSWWPTSRSWWLAGSRATIAWHETMRSLWIPWCCTRKLHKLFGTWKNSLDWTHKTRLGPRKNKSDILLGYFRYFGHNEMIRFLKKYSVL